MKGTTTRKEGRMMMKMQRIIGIGVAVLFLGVGLVSADVITFQQNVGGYTGTVDTCLRSYNTAAKTTNFGEYKYTYIGRGTTPDITIIRFEDLFGVDEIPTGATVNSATLTFSNTGTNGSVIDIQVSDLKVAWVEMEATYTIRSAADGNWLGNNPLDSQNKSDAFTTLSTDGTAPFTVTVTDSVRGWLDGNANYAYGLMLHGLSTSQNVASYCPSDGEVSVSQPSRNPLLTVDYTPIPEPGTMCLLGLGGVSVLIRRRK